MASSGEEKPAGPEGEAPEAAAAAPPEAGGNAGEKDVPKEGDDKGGVAGKEKEKAEEKSRRSRSRSRDRKDKRRSRSRSRDRRDRRRRSRSRSRDRRRSRSRDRRRRSRSRDRRRSRSRDRRRSRSRSRERSRGNNPIYSTRYGFGGSGGGGGRSGRRPAVQSGVPLGSARPLIGGTGIGHVVGQSAEEAIEALRQQQIAAQMNAAQKSAREVYVGNLMPGMVTEEALRTLFNASLEAAGYPRNPMTGAEPVLGVKMSLDGKYAFVEFATEDQATVALQLNGIELMGMSLSVRNSRPVGRPSGYDPAAAVSQLGQIAQASAAGIPISQIAPQIAPPPPPPAPLAGGLALAAAGLIGAGMGLGAGAGGVQLPGPPPGPSSGGPAVTQYVCLIGLVSKDMLDDPEEYEGIQEDIKGECERAGPVVALLVPKSGPNVGKAFVEFSDAGAAEKARGMLDGRKFDGNDVVATFVSKAEIDANR